MDGYAWAAVEPAGASDAPTVEFRNAPPPDDTQPVAIRGLRGITAARAANNGELFVARPAEGAAAVAREDPYEASYTADPKAAATYWR
jgi:hypothetical protein